MNNKDYLIVATLGETRNITRTAERLFMTQSAISKRIKLIEQEFSCDLLVRSRHGIFFTKAGEHILDFCRNTLEELDADFRPSYEVQHKHLQLQVYLHNHKPDPHHYH